MKKARMYQKKKGFSYAESLEIDLSNVFSMIVILERKKGKITKADLAEIRRYLTNCMSAEKFKGEISNDKL